MRADEAEIWLFDELDSDWPNEEQKSLSDLRGRSDRADDAARADHLGLRALLEDA